MSRRIRRFSFKSSPSSTSSEVNRHRRKVIWCIYQIFDFSSHKLMSGQNKHHLLFMRGAGGDGGRSIFFCSATLLIISPPSSFRLLNDSPDPPYDSPVPPASSPMGLYNAVSELQTSSTGEMCKNWPIHTKATPPVVLRWWGPISCSQMTVITVEEHGSFGDFQRTPTDDRLGSDKINKGASYRERESTRRVFPEQIAKMGHLIEELPAEDWPFLPGPLEYRQKFQIVNSPLGISVSQLTLYLNSRVTLSLKQIPLSITSELRPGMSDKEEQVPHRYEKRREFITDHHRLHSDGVWSLDSLAL